MFAPLVISAQAGVRSVSIGRVQAALSLGASRRQLFFHVVLPGAFALPEILTGLRRLTSVAYLTFVAIDADKKRIPIPGLILETEEEKRKAAEADVRRADRLEARKKLEARQ